ncbi:hypothetical protein [Roseivivax halodurans]|uniref:hypothetical protein n=1 Tax=Roseivivax halodurans TaxID=93683 RepID=UPI0012F7DD8B|nr:hypothetical protein [Roseivivax halodurans]
MSGQLARLSLPRNNEKSIHAFWHTGSECDDIFACDARSDHHAQGSVPASAAKWYRPDIPAAAEPSVDAH